MIRPLKIRSLRNPRNKLRFAHRANANFKRPENMVLNELLIDSTILQVISLKQLDTVGKAKDVKHH